MMRVRARIFLLSQQETIMSAQGFPAYLSLVPSRPARTGRPAWQWVIQAFQALRTRRLLAEMDDRMLSDIGISRAEARVEAMRAPWDIDLQA